MSTLDILQASHCYRLTLKLVCQVLHARKNVTSLKHKLVMGEIIMRLLNR